MKRWSIIVLIAVNVLLNLCVLPSNPLPQGLDISNGTSPSTGYNAGSTGVRAASDIISRGFQNIFLSAGSAISSLFAAVTGAAGFLFSEVGGMKRYGYNQPSYLNQRQPDSSATTAASTDTTEATTAAAAA